MYIVPPRPPPPWQQDRSKQAFRHNLFELHIGDAPRAAIQKRTESQESTQEVATTAPATPRPPSTASSTAQLPDTMKAAVTDSRQPLLSSIGQKMQNYARKYYAQRLDQQSQQKLEAAALAQVQRDRIRAQQADRASLSHLERVTAGLAKLTHCTPPFNPTLWLRATRRTSSPISDDYEDIPPSTPESTNGYEDDNDDPREFDGEYELILPRDSAWPPIRAGEESMFARNLRQMKMWSPDRVSSGSTTPSLETPVRRPSLDSPSSEDSATPSPVRGHSLDSPGKEEIFHTPSSTNKNKPTLTSPSPPPQYTISPRRDSVTGALQLSQQGSLAARMEDAEISDPKAWLTQQWLEDALAAAIESPQRETPEIHGGEEIEEPDPEVSERPTKTY